MFTANTLISNELKTLNPNTNLLLTSNFVVELDSTFCTISTETLKSRSFVIHLIFAVDPTSSADDPENSPNPTLNPLNSRSPLV